MGRKVAGTVYVKVDAEQLTVAGSVECSLSEYKRESIAPGYYKEEELVPFVKLTCVHDPDLPIKKLMASTNSTLSVELASGAVYSLSGAYVVHEPSLKADEGTIELEWNGNKGTWW